MNTVGFILLWLAVGAVWTFNVWSGIVWKRKVQELDKMLAEAERIRDRLVHKGLESS